MPLLFFHLYTFKGSRDRAIRLLEKRQVVGEYEALCRQGPTRSAVQEGDGHGHISASDLL